jgi:hypothetical protein
MGYATQDMGLNLCVSNARIAFAPTPFHIDIIAPLSHSSHCHHPYPTHRRIRTQLRAYAAVVLHCSSRATSVSTHFGKLVSHCINLASIQYHTVSRYHSFNTQSQSSYLFAISILSKSNRRQQLRITHQHISGRFSTHQHATSLFQRLVAI